MFFLSGSRLVSNGVNYPPLSLNQIITRTLEMNMDSAALT